MYAIMAWRFLICYFFRVALSESRCIFTLGISFQVLLTLFSYGLSIRLFFYVHFIPIFCSKIVLFSCHWVVCTSTCILPILAGRIFFHCFIIIITSSCISFIISSILLLVSFSHKFQLVSFHRSLSNTKSSRVSRTFLSILVDLNNVVVWMILILFSISMCSNLFFNPLETVPRAPMTIGIIVTLMSNIFLVFKQGPL